MCFLKIRCKAVKENLVFPITSFIFLFIAIYLSLFTKFNEHYINILFIWKYAIFYTFINISQNVKKFNL